MFAVQGNEGKRSVTFAEDLAPAADAPLKEKIAYALKKTPLSDPTKRFLIYNVSAFVVTIFGIVQYGEALAI